MAKDPATLARLPELARNLWWSWHLVQGVDVWPNTPRLPVEASGTSGEKAAVNGAPNLGVLDLFLGLLGSAGASWVWYLLVRDGELIVLNALTLLTPAFALLLALAVYREPLSPPGLAGAGAVLVAVTAVGWPRVPGVPPGSWLNAKTPEAVCTSRSRSRRRCSRARCTSPRWSGASGRDGVARRTAAVVEGTHLVTHASLAADRPPARWR